MCVCGEEWKKGERTKTNIWETRMVSIEYENWYSVFQWRLMIAIKIIKVHCDAPIDLDQLFSMRKKPKSKHQKKTKKKKDENTKILIKYKYWQEKKKKSSFWNEKCLNKHIKKYSLKFDDNFLYLKYEVNAMQLLV